MYVHVFFLPFFKITFLYFEFSFFNSDFLSLEHFSLSILRFYCVSIELHIHAFFLFLSLFIHSYFRNYTHVSHIECQIGVDGTCIRGCCMNVNWTGTISIEKKHILISIGTSPHGRIAAILFASYSLLLSLCAQNFFRCVVFALLICEWKKSVEFQCIT